MVNNNWNSNDDDDISLPLHQRTEELYRISDAVIDSNGIIEAPVLPLRDIVVYPQMISPLFVGRAKSLWAIEESQSLNQTLIALTQMEADRDRPGPDDFFPIGVEMAVGRLLNMPDGSNSALVQARRRVELIQFTQMEPYLRAKVRIIDDDQIMDRDTDASMRTALELFERCVELDRSIPEEAYLFALNIDDPGWLADMIATSLSPSTKDRQQVLQITNSNKRLDFVINLLAGEISVLELEDEIQSKTKSEVDQSQREYYLREQMKIIQNELGEDDPTTLELTDLQARVESVGLPEEVEVRALKELGRLSHIPPISPEGGIIRTYVEWILELPWSEKSSDNLDVNHANQVLEKNHYGLNKVKERILEYIAVKKLRPPNARQPILCFVGPPGTGKTSLGKSIAEALGRKFVRVSLGGVRDEAEIRGHRRTYIGALPGRVIQTMRKADTINPLFMLDEIDKLGSDFRGDPSAALLEVLDPEQNFEFSDHYLEIPYDLSKVFFITTANTDVTIPPALFDRMEMIEFPGYIEEEKIEIAQRFLIPKQVDENGIGGDDINFSQHAIQKIIQEYTYEAGVRNLEREIGKICRKIARLKAEGKSYPENIGVTSIERFLGPPQFFNTMAEEEDEVGVAMAVAWTSAGGEIMPVEVLLTEGKGNLQITGQIGDVMQESAQAALTFIKSRAESLGIDEEDFENKDIHIHIPEGSIQKDGPSAGVTIATALVSIFTEQKVRSEVGMTGEITLRGKILPVGGIREKLLSAYRAGLKKVLIPEKNMKDLVDIPKQVLNELEIIPVTRIEEVWELAVLDEEIKQT